MSNFSDHADDDIEEIEVDDEDVDESDIKINWNEPLYLPTPKIAAWTYDFFSCLNNAITGKGDENLSTLSNRPEIKQYLTDLSKFTIQKGSFDFEFGSYRDPAFDFKPKYLTVFSLDNGNLAALLEAVQVVYKHFQLDDVFTLEWSEFSEEVREGDNGGGAAVVTRSEIKTMTTSQMVDQLTEGLNK